MSTDHRTDQPTNRRTPADRPQVEQYEIRVRGHLGDRWASWFDGFAITAADDGTSVICGSVVDQAALHGLLQKLRDLGIPLLSLTQLAPGATAEPHRLNPDETRHTSPGAPA